MMDTLKYKEQLRLMNIEKVENVLGMVYVDSVMKGLYVHYLFKVGDHEILLDEGDFASFCSKLDKGMLNALLLKEGKFK